MKLYRDDDPFPSLRRENVRNIGYMLTVLDILEAKQLTFSANPLAGGLIAEVDAPGLFMFIQDAELDRSHEDAQG